MFQSFRKGSLDDDTDFSEQIVCKDSVNHSEKLMSTGGIVYLLQNKLIFIPHKINISKKELTIFFSDIDYISDYKIWGLVGTGLKITLKSGKVEKFVADKTGDFYRQLMNQFRNK